MTKAVSLLEKGVWLKDHVRLGLTKIGYKPRKDKDIVFVAGVDDMPITDETNPMIKIETKF